MNDFFEIYDALLNGISCTEPVTAATVGENWSLIKTDKYCGMAMTTDGNSIQPMFPDGFIGQTLEDAAAAAKSWNLAEASLGMAAVNAFYNSPERMVTLGSYEPYENYCTDGIDFTDKTVGIIGHMHGPKGMREAARNVYILERKPQPGDYPDPACDVILPQCDIVLITGSTFINKTLPHLLELCRGCYTILTGPSVPMCPQLLDFGIDRIAGMIIDDYSGILNHTVNNLHGSPYYNGRPFLIRK